MFNEKIPNSIEKCWRKIIDIWKKKMNEVVKIGFENIERIQFDKLEKDFSFIVNDQIYRTNSIVAAILSPRISNLLEENMKIS